MQYNRGFQGEYKGGCGSWGHHKGQWGKSKWAEMWKQKMARFNAPPINIEESDTAFVIALFAAGLDKAKVALTVKDDVLTISYPGSETTEGQETYSYQEHRQGAFERQFQLNNKVLTDQISATYADGILRVTLPKNPETNVPAQTIVVE